MTADDAAITGDGSDATREVFRAVDAYGNQRRYTSGEVMLHVTGPAEFIGTTRSRLPSTAGSARSGCDPGRAGRGRSR